MKKEIHPQYFKDTSVICACGKTMKMGATKEHMETEICSNCHPFYTGKKNIVDTLGRVEKYKKRLAKKKTTVKKKATAKKK